MTTDELDLGSLIRGMNDKNARDGIHTMAPGEIVSYNPLKRTCSVKPTVNRVTKEGVIEYPVLEDVKVHFIGGGGYHVTFELKPGDTGGIFFSEVALAEWQTLGGVVTPGSARHHHMSDAFFIPGIWPDVDVPYTHVGDGITIHNDEGTKHIRLGATGIHLLGDLGVEGSLVATGDIEATGDISSSTGDIIAGTVSLKTHTHTTPTTGTVTAPETTSPPVP